MTTQPAACACKSGQCVHLETAAAVTQNLAMCRLLCVAVSALTLFACKEAGSHAPVAPGDNKPRPERNRDAGEDADSADAAPGNEENDAPSIVPGPLYPSAFYWVGRLDPTGAASVDCYRLGVQDLLHNRPGLGLLGDCEGQRAVDYRDIGRTTVVSPYNGSLVYMQRATKADQDWLIRFFTPDVVRVLSSTLYEYPTNPLDNDPVLSTLCPPVRFWLSPDSDWMVYECEPLRDGYYRNTGEVYSVPDGYRLVHLGFENYALVYGRPNRPGSINEYAVLDGSGTLTPVMGSDAMADPFNGLNGFVRSDYLMQPRATTSGFLLVQEHELNEITYAGRLVVRGNYPVEWKSPPTADINAESFATQYSCPTHNCNFEFEWDWRGTGCGVDSNGALVCAAKFSSTDSGTVGPITFRMSVLGEVSFLSPPGFNPRNPQFPQRTTRHPAVIGGLATFENAPSSAYLVSGP